MSPRPAFESVPAYLAALDAAQKKALSSVLALVRRTVPDATPVISYGIPAFKLDRVFIYCAAFRRHIGVYPPVRNNSRVIQAARRYANAKGNLSFPLDEPMPLELIRKVALALASENGSPGSTRAKVGRARKKARIDKSR